ncbi:GTP cyclohydrolase II [Harenicola maris]
MADLRMGLPVAITGPWGTGLVFAAETVDDSRFAAAMGMGGVEVAVTAWRAATLKARVYDGDVARLAVPRHASLRWLRSVADPASDLEHPMKGPFREVREGSADIHRMAIALTKEARLLPAALVLPVVDAVPEGLTLLQVTAESAARLSAYHVVSAARLPTALGGAGRLRVFRPDDGGEEHYAVTIGTPDLDGPVLVRLHSACFTGDILGSLKCDCGPQLHAAMAAMGREGAGVILYLNQEGRGIGLANKMRAYALQDQGFDTVEANHRLGFEDDERDFRIGSELLGVMGITRVRLMTNNPLKVAMMETQGISVTERVPIAVGETEHNRAYLAVKAAKSGHLL